MDTESINTVILVKERRKSLGLSYQQIANKIGLSKSTIHRYESGAIKNLTVDKLSLLAKALNTSPSHLMGWPKVNYSCPTYLTPELLETEFVKLLIKAKPLLAQCGFEIDKLDHSKLQQLSIDTINSYKTLSFKYNKE